MTVTLPIEVHEGRLDHAEAELLVAPFFENHRPLRGPAARVDWRLCGLLSEQLAGARVAGARGEAVLIATAGRFRVPSVLAFGLGPKPGFSERDLEKLAADLVDRLAGLRKGRVALALPDDTTLGFPIEAAAHAVVSGLARGLARRPTALHLQLFGGPSLREVLAGARRAAETAPTGIELRVSPGASTSLTLRPTSSGATAPARPAATTPGLRPTP